ncbi:MAG: hypothetical protein NTW87_35935, partial [Planctomycetota bacterium]|nr:hypothetical protein [Planctomycetota bacterium]
HNNPKRNYNQQADPDVRKRALERQRQCAPLSVIPLRAALKSPDPEIQKAVREELKRLGPAGAPTLEAK